MTSREITAIGGTIVAIALILSAPVYELGKMWGWWGQRFRHGPRR